MSEMSFEQMLEESLKTIRNGEVVEGTVIDVKPDEIILNIGYKSDGIITRNEYTNEPNVDLTTVVKAGDTLEAKVVKVNDGEGQVLLSYKRLAAEKGNKRLEEAFENQEILKAKVSQVLTGGVCVNVDETRVFIPASLVSDTYEKDLAKYADPLVSIGNQTGEGWFLTGEIMELIHSGVNNVVCTQPFGCLPNHIVGKGVIKEIRHQYPESNIIAVDYDPGASEVNQLNRIKLMLASAQSNLDKDQKNKK